MPALTLPRLAAATLLLAAATLAQAQSRPAAGEQPVPPLPAAALKAQPKADTSTAQASLPAKGLFNGNQLTEAAKKKLADMVIDAIGSRIEVVLIMPTGAWNTDGSGKDERDLTPARIDTVKRFLSERGVEPKRAFVESRIDGKAKEARLDVQVIRRQATD